MKTSLRQLSQLDMAFRTRYGFRKINKHLQNENHSHKVWLQDRIHETKSLLTQDSGQLEQRRAYDHLENHVEQP